MVKAAVEVVSIAARQDMRGLLKEYARLGYKETYHGSERGFDDLWRTAFPPAQHAPPKVPPVNKNAVSAALALGKVLCVLSHGRPAHYGVCSPASSR